LGTPATAHHCSRCATASTFNADIEGRLMDARLDTEFWRERLQSRRARRAAPFMVTGTRGCGELLASWPERSNFKICPAQPRTELQLSIEKCTSLFQYRIYHC
jgi:hypothetical protein